MGKSTLLNAILEEKVAIVSSKPQTTRTLIRGIYTSEAGQIIFVDTPGIHKPRYRLGEHMVSKARRSMGDADVVVLVYDAAWGWSEEEAELLTALKRLDRKHLVVANKADLVREIRPPEGLDETRWFLVSARTGEGLEELVKAIFDLLEPGPMYYPPEMVTDQPEQVVAAELVREAILHLTHDEVPHSVAVEVEEFRYDEKKDLTVIRATIYVERASQRKIIIGHRGSMIKEIGKLARAEIEKMVASKVFLDLWVKVKEKWRDREGTLQSLGLGADQ